MDPVDQYNWCLKEFYKLVEKVKKKTVRPTVFAAACIHFFASVLDSIEVESDRETVKRFINDVEKRYEMLRRERLGLGRSS